ncbi:fasciculation and elongation protein zeta-2-like isoform X3 [Lethenteron reissneri]|uniref:fasciculation and elongation protein zeta-2-like isoform X3 n=1 Tax=Lethenteron reissneri TaxID=7753 RepID=UPI002AB642CB|nr:fasciculation and elongation protein zeta-2-like isoform X3 [Lethenteron reissneri]
MRGANMAAPLAHFDEDWQDFNEFKAPLTAAASSKLDDSLNSNAADAAADEDDDDGGDVRGGGGGGDACGGGAGVVKVACSSSEELGELVDNFSGDLGCSFQSMEDLVSGFEEQLTACFRNFNAPTEALAPVRALGEADGLRDDELWNKVTDNYGNVMPVDWSSSHTRTLYLPTLNLNQKKEKEGVNLDLSDDEELRDQLDMHSIIVSCMQPEEPLFTAEQVIEELEEMMQESPDPEPEGVPTPGQSDRLSLLSLEVAALKQSPVSDKGAPADALKGLSVARLMEMLEDMETAVRTFSEELIQQLALRDELEFEKEVKNSFIAALVEVQNKQKEFRDIMKKKRRSNGASPSHRRDKGTIAPGTYLTTVIPYEDKEEPPSVQQLQVLIKILKAMKDDSDRVPSLLTDYILKVM